MHGVIGVSHGILDIYRRSGLLEGVRSTHVIYTVPPATAPPSAADVEVLGERLQLGGRRIWEYRYCWQRDAAFMGSCLLKAGFDDEA